MSGVVFLLMESEERVVRSELAQSLTVLGADPACEVFVRGESVAERHAQISQGDEHFWLRALDDAEVTVNGSVLYAAHALSNGDRIGLGSEELLFVDPPLVSLVTTCLIIRRPNAVELGCWSAQSRLSIGTSESDIPLLDTGLDGVALVIENYCLHGQFVVGSHDDPRLLLNGVPLEGRSRLISGDVLRMADVEIQLTFAASLWEALPDHLKRDRRSPRSDSAFRTRKNRGISTHTGGALGLNRRRSAPNKNAQLNRSAPRVNTGQTQVRQMLAVDGRSVGHISAPWYVPQRDSSERRRLPRPIIRARGDRVVSTTVDSSGETHDQLERRSNPRKKRKEKARIRRKSSPDHISTQDLRRPADMERFVNDGSLGENERWYVPSKDGTEPSARVRSQSETSRWYIPDANVKSEDSNAITRDPLIRGGEFSGERRKKNTRSYDP